MSIAYNDRRPAEPDWDDYKRTALEVVVLS